MTLLVGWQEGHPAVKKLSGEVLASADLSGVRCKSFACGPADATATLSSLVPVKSRMLYLSGAGLSRLSWKKGRQMDVVVVVVVALSKKHSVL